MTLTICICSLVERRDFLNKILNQLTPQLNSEVELLILTDNRKRSLGKKRQNALNIAQGEYLVFMDDDDRITSDYVSELLNAIKNNTDTITYQVEVTINGKDNKVCLYDMNYGKDFDTNENYHRLPNHICCTKLSIMREVGFKDITFGEDADYAKRLKPLLKTQTSIDKILYYYDFNTNTTTTRGNNG